MTWNATGVMSSCTYLCNTLNENSIDICGIAEHWLFERDLHFLDSIDNMYCSYAVSDFSLSLPSNRRVGKGGVCILWKRSLSNMITQLEIDDDRIIGIKIQINSENIIYVFQVYVPCSNHGIESFKSYMEKIENIFFRYSQTGIVLVMGDFNAESNMHNRRNVYFTDVLTRNNIVSLNDIMLHNAFTNFSYNGGIGSSIDHILVACEKMDLVTTCFIPDDNALNVSSHRPIICSFPVPGDPNSNSDVQEHRSRVNWSKVTESDLNEYRSFVQSHIERSETLNQDIVCESQIDCVYSDIVSLINEANDKCLPKSKFKHFLKPYWDDELKQVCKLSKTKRRNWISDGKPRGMEHSSYAEYKNAKRILRKTHRKKVQQYMSKQYDELDRYADIDSTLFWKCINRRRNKFKSAVGNELVFNGTTFRDPKLINENWARFFKSLYSPSEDAHFDAEYKEQIVNDLKEVNDIVLSKPVTKDECFVSTEAVKFVCDKAKRNKACGPDGCFYENIKFGGNSLLAVCSRYFTAMLTFSYCPPDMKKGEIIVLHKGGNKAHNDPNNYRAITLSSVLLKLYEAIILYRMKLSANPINDLQGGFRQGMGCMMTSFLFRECNNYVIENNSKLYSCFLDVRQAFDRVWHEALMVKLFRTNIDLYLYRAICNLYQSMVSRVRSNGHTSKWFPVLQGTRQGGVISPHLYLVFINDLMDELCRSNYGLHVYGLNCTCPSSADDMVLLSLSKDGLQELMNICYKYGCSYRYSYNANKSAVIVSNESAAVTRTLTKNREWSLGNACVQEHDTYMHLGVLFHGDSDLSNIVTECSSKLRRTLLSIVNCGIFEGGLHPLTAKHLYETIVLPRALYGCELWSNLLDSEINTLEIAHRFCLKIIQSIPRLSRTDIVLSSLGMLPIEAEIDKRKLVFFGQLCRLDIDTTVKRLFIHRLCEYNNCPSRIRGFIPDLFGIFQKYRLNDTLTTFCSTGIFPSKYTWKRLVNSKINIKHASLLESRVLADVTMCDYSIIQSLSEVKPCTIWLVSRSNRDLLRLSQATVKLTVLLFSKPYICKCRQCQRLTDNIALHLAFFCDRTVEIRNVLWGNILCYCGYSTFRKLMWYSPRMQLIHILSGLRNIYTCDVDSNTDVLKIVASFCFKLLKSKSSVIL